MLQKKNIKFFEEEHKYIDVDSNTEYTSVTRFLSEFKTDFDIEAKSLKKANELGISQEEVLKIWEDKKNLACDVGTLKHKSFEYFNLTGEIINENHKDFLMDYSYKSKKVAKKFPEKLVYYPPAKIAGTSDNILLLEKGLIDIEDYKTNEKLDWNHYNKKYKPPIDYLYESKIQTYELQLSVYAWICEQWGLKVNELYLWWVKEKTVEKINLKYRKKTVENLIQHRIKYLN